jgi:hypothetical protein
MARRLAWVGRSTGKVLDVLFGWAVRALFGQTSRPDRLFLAGLVAAAAVWPLLLVAAIFPTVAISHGIASSSVRPIGLALFLAVPLSVGLAVAANGPPFTSGNEPFWKRVLRGFPVTVALAGALLVMLVSVPMRLAAALRKERSSSLPLMTDATAYHQVVAMILTALNQHAFGLRPGTPAWWFDAPIRLLGRLAGDAFRAFLPQTLQHYVAPDLEVSFYANRVVLTGQRRKVSWARGVIEEVVAHTGGLQTEAPAAQNLERLIRRVWMVHDEIGDNPPNRGRLLQMVDRIARRLGGLDIDSDDWQILYRQLMQVERAVRGQRQILEENSAYARIGAAEASHRAATWDSETTRPNILMHAGGAGEAREG